MSAALKVESVVARDDDLRELWAAIREAQNAAATALSKVEVHQAECRGNQRVIEHRLGQITHLLMGAFATLGTILSGLAIWAIPRLLGAG